MENLLGVKWFDGLVVAQRHMLQSDRRVDALIAKACRACADQPGVLDSVGSAGSPSQLLQVIAATKTERGIKITFELARSFVALAPSGRVVIGYSAQHGTSIPKQNISALCDLDQLAGVAEAVVCVRQHSYPDLTVKHSDGMESMELDYPGLSAIVIPAASYVQRCEGDSEDYVAVAMIGFGGEQPAIKVDFIPPLVRLGAAASFDTGIIANLQSGYDRLFGVLSEQVEAAGAAFAKGNAGADLMSRRSDYEALRALMIARKGMIADLGQTSTRGLLRECIQPMAFWWLHHKRRHFKDIDGQPSTTPLGRVSPTAESLMSLSHGDVCAGSSSVLRGGHEFMADLASVIEITG